MIRRNLIDFFDIPKEHFSPIVSLRNNDLHSLVKENLSYCPICMRVGYHSYLFQLSFIHKCPLQDKTNNPARKYFDIRSARELIDGIWDKSSIPKRMLTQAKTDSQIIFFSPYKNTIGSTNISTQKSRDTLLNRLFFRISNDKIKP